MKEYNFSGRRSLGRRLSRIEVDPEADDEDYRRRIRGEKIFCGLYVKGAEITATIAMCNSINEFFFNTGPTVTKTQLKEMESVLQIRHNKSKALMYQAREYTSDLGQIKLFYDQSLSMHRVKIIDLYTVPYLQQLKMQATLYMIDTGTYRYNVSFNYLFDAPQRIRYYKDIEPEVKQSRLYLGPPVPLDYVDEEINSYFCQRIAASPTKEFTVKILDFNDCIYHVDLLDKSGRSFIEHLRKKFQHKISALVEAKIAEGYGLLSRYDLSLMNEIQSITINEHVTKGKPKKRNPNFYTNLSTYFWQRLLANLQNPKLSFLQKRFLRVRIYSWRDPESFYIVPDDPDYIEYHGEFVKEIQASRPRSSHPDAEPDHSFKVGDLCYFKNDYDKHFGDWVRGVVMEAPSLIGGVIKPTRIGYMEGSDSQDSIEFRHLINRFVYRVESIDYGFICIRSAQSMRRITNVETFFCRGTWSLKCRLFGVYPLGPGTNPDGSPKFSETCLSTIDFWIRERLLDHGRFSHFYILFRSDIKHIPRTWRSAEPQAEVTVFHRHEPPYSITDWAPCARQRKTRYDCLNSYIILDRGVATDHNQSDVPSRVELDHFAVNLLVPHDRI